MVVCIMSHCHYYYYYYIIIIIISMHHPTPTILSIIISRDFYVHLVKDGVTISKDLTSSKKLLKSKVSVIHFYDGG